MSKPRRWAVILGASSGFGEATALALAREGFDVVGVHLDRKATQPNAERIAAEIVKMGREAMFFNVNAADADNRKQVCDAIAARFQKDGGGQVMTLMHSLAFGALGPIVGDGALTRDRLEMTLDVMANSLVYWTQDLLIRKLIGKGTRIFAMTSEGSNKAWTGYGAVSAAKSALESYIRQLAVELGSQGISSVAILAGGCDTPAARKIPGWDAMMARMLSRHPSGRLTVPEDVAGVIASLSRGDTPWITGVTLNVDGGENIV